MWRDICSHSDSNSCRAVYEEVRNPCGQDNRLLCCLVKVRREIYGLLVYIGQKLFCYFCQSRLCVPVCSGRITVYGAEIALPVHKHIPHIKVLCQPYHGIINSRVTVGMVFFQNLADNTGAFRILLVREKAFPEHCVKDSPLNRLQPVPYLRQSPSYDYTHGVIKVAGFHLFFYAYECIGCRHKDCTSLVINYSGLLF